MALTITLSNTSGASYVFSKILQFQLKKEVYTPYTIFSAQFQTDGLKKFGTICKVIRGNIRQPRLPDASSDAVGFTIGTN